MLLFPFRSNNYISFLFLIIFLIFLSVLVFRFYEFSYKSEAIFYLQCQNMFSLILMFILWSPP